MKKLETIIKELIEKLGKVIEEEDDCATEEIIKISRKLEKAIYEYLNKMSKH